MKVSAWKHHLEVGQPLNGDCLATTGIPFDEPGCYIVVPLMRPYIKTYTPVPRSINAGPPENQALHQVSLQFEAEDGDPIL